MTARRTPSVSSVNLTSTLSDEESVIKVSNTGWFSAVLRFVIVNEHDGLWRHVISVVLIQASDFNDAFARALEVGRLAEERYVNSDGEGVRWALERVETIDALPENLYHGVEVAWWPFESAGTSSVQFDTVFHPERHYPDQSGIAPT